MVRIVVQRVRDAQGNVFRLIAYDSHATYYAVDFGSLEDVLRTLHSVAPNFDEKALSLDRTSQEASIVLTGTMELEEPQLSALGLKRKEHTF